MLRSVVEYLRCPACRTDAGLDLNQFEDAGDGHVKNGILICRSCRSWYAIEDELADLVTPALIDHEDHARFLSRFGDLLNALGLDSEVREIGDPLLPQIVQRQHFDWYAANPQQSYQEYQKSPFWVAFDRTTFTSWKTELRPGSMLLDVGCADGRSSFPFVDSGSTIIGMDVSKGLLRQAIRRAADRNARPSTTFVVADASVIPFQENTLDFVVVYGVLHHVPDPPATCREVLRVLKPGGVYFGSENNATVLRRIFDLLMKLQPIWQEKAGDHALISYQELKAWFGGLPVAFDYRASVFLPPHLFNLLGHGHAPRLLNLSDRLFGSLPGVRHHGGLNVFEVRKL